MTSIHNSISSLAMSVFFSLWAGIFGDYFIGPYVLPTPAGGRDCHDFLRTRSSELLEDVSRSVSVLACGINTTVLPTLQ
jgi:hypothetical protein